jgi:NAD-dependent DNA ligase
MRLELDMWERNSRYFKPEFSSIEELKSASFEHLASIEGIGEKIAGSIINYLAIREYLSCSTSLWSVA